MTAWERFGRVESGRAAVRVRGPRKARRPIGVARGGGHLGHPQIASALERRPPSLRAIAAASSK